MFGQRRFSVRCATAALAVLVGIGAIAPIAEAVLLTVRVENRAASDGTFLTPMWVGFHDASFDLYDMGAPASAGLEQIAEDGDPTTLNGEFSAAQPSGTQGLITGPGPMLGDDAGEPPVIDPGEITSLAIDVDGSINRYFSYASMVIPSNDAFIANGDPAAHEIFDAAGNFLGPVSILVPGSSVLDAGTEDNTEMDAAFINQGGPNTGDTTVGGVVGLHSGFIGSEQGPSGTPIILGGSNGLGATFDSIAADFTRAGFEVALITITPEPGSAVLLAAGAMMMLRRRKQD